MIKSMTGYGRAVQTFENREITVEIRSVNNRYLDCTVKMPRMYTFAEDAVKKHVQQAVSRGKVDVFITGDATAADVVKVAVNRELAAQYAAALGELRGGTAEQCAEAFAMALTNLEGLVCDPVAGLVEIPCIKRNVIGAMNAVSCADMALAGVVGHIPADEVIDAMAEVGAAMSNDLRETGIGGLAGTPTGKAIRDIVQMQG